MQIAQTILSQLGGNRFIAMTGAKNLGAGSNSLQFHFPKGAKSRANICRVTLETSDTYLVEFWNYNRAKLTTTHVGEPHRGIYADQLQALFTEVTGLDTHL